MRCGAVRSSAVWCGVGRGGAVRSSGGVWCGGSARGDEVRCGVVWCGAEGRCSVVCYVLCGVMWCDVMWCSVGDGEVRDGVTHQVFVQSCSEPSRHRFSSSGLIAPYSTTRAASATGTLHLSEFVMLPETADDSSGLGSSFADASSDPPSLQLLGTLCDGRVCEVCNCSNDMMCAGLASIPESLQQCPDVVWKYPRICDCCGNEYDVSTTRGLTTKGMHFAADLMLFVRVSHFHSRYVAQWHALNCTIYPRRQRPECHLSMART